MASRADALDTTPTRVAAPRIGRVVREALSDFYFNSGRLVAANVAWGGGALGLYVVWSVWPLGALVLTPLLAFPTVGVFRLAARIVRKDGHISARDAFSAYRDYAGPTLLLGLGSVVAGLILLTNAVVGLTGSEPVGWAVGTLAAWGLIVAWCLAMVAWPLLVDPARAGVSAATRLRLAGLLVVAFPVRFALLGAVIAVIAVTSTILMAALLTISVSFVALVACRYVYAAADRFDDPASGRRSAQ